jgi:hypothetical protein
MFQELDPAKATFPSYIMIEKVVSKGPRYFPNIEGVHNAAAMNDIL